MREMLQVLNERIRKLLSEKRIPKTEISEKLGIGYSTLWRRLNGERSINVDFLLELAKVLGTTASELLYGLDKVAPDSGNESTEINIIPVTVAPDMNSDITSKETLHHEMPGHLVFKHGDYYIDIPDTPSNQEWFRELTSNMLMPSVTEKPDNNQLTIKTA